VRTPRRLWRAREAGEGGWGGVDESDRPAERGHCIIYFFGMDSEKVQHPNKCNSLHSTVRAFAARVCHRSAHPSPGTGRHPFRFSRLLLCEALTPRARPTGPPQRMACIALRLHGCPSYAHRCVQHESDSCAHRPRTMHVHAHVRCRYRMRVQPPRHASAARCGPVQRHRKHQRARRFLPAAAATAAAAAAPAAPSAATEIVASSPSAAAAAAAAACKDMRVRLCENEKRVRTTE